MVPSSKFYDSERVIVEDSLKRESDFLVYMFHLATYDFAAPFIEGKRVLDYGCGTGYGTHRLAALSKSIVGVDVSESAIAFAQKRYPAKNLNFRQIQADEDALPFPDSSFDVVLSFQVIEHVPDPPRYLAEVRRLLTKDGLLLLATPDRSTRLLRGQRPWNRYHRTEYDSAQLTQLLESQFPVVEMNVMGGEPAVVERELRRSRRMKWITLPFTFPGAPEAWRQAGLGALKGLQSRFRERANVSGTEAVAPTGGAGEEIAPSHAYSFDQSAIRIAPTATPRLNLVAITRAAADRT
jgi:SAM-dependent methyltransferase